ncbi:MAG: ATP-binding protein [Lewinellaceae bacterium]|nr:ATP-binding protein [Lewinellaceae bacterium]
MIDEIDTGIHYSRMKNFLKTVFRSQKNDVQLFMTTHSLECQQAFAEVFEESDMAQYQEKVRQFTLLEKQMDK